MARLNKSGGGTGPRTHEGAPAVVPRSKIAALRRSVLSCLLWEKEFYEDGQTIADRITSLAAECKPEDVAALAIEARKVMNLRHAPLLLTLSLFGRKPAFAGARATVAQVISRADELSEIVAMYWRGGKKPLPAALKRGLADAFRKFDEYRLAKYDRPTGVKLKDVLKLVRPKPVDEEQAALWGRLKNGTMKTPDTWETNLSGGKDKKETFERLLDEGNLGYLALLRNLRNMEQAGVDRAKIVKAIEARKGARYVFPFRYIAAERHAPAYSAALDKALLQAIGEMPKLDGLTVVLVDVSGSMDWQLSAKSDMKRIDAATGLAAIIPADDLRVFSFSNNLVEVPARRGLAGAEAVKRSQPHGGTAMGAAIKAVSAKVKNIDRFIVITDEQSGDVVGAGPAPAGRNYLINVASAQNSVGFGDWVRLNGFSEGVLRWIHELELVAEKTVKLPVTQGEMAEA